MKPSAYNLYLLAKIPIAFLAGVRVKKLSPQSCTTRVALSYLSQNPFQSMFWAVQGMAGEFSTGILLADLISRRDLKVSMLVRENSAVFTKKARGKITFTCSEGEAITQALDTLTLHQEPLTLELHSKGVDASGDTVSEFTFVWSLKLKAAVV